MKSYFAPALAFAASTLLYTNTAAQTYTSCNPLTQGNCPADPALGSAVSIDFTKGASSQFSSSGPITYSSNGASFSIAKSGDSPTITSNWYIMFGKVEAVIKAAPGTGIVSSCVLQSDDLDEIDWEWLGADAANVQSNYFGKGYTGDYDRGGTHPIATSQSAFNTYTVDWNANQITWSINGQVVRTLLATSANGQFPQSPMRVKIGSWSAGDPSNPAGTIAWAGGNTNYAAGPYVMGLKSAVITDYSTGKTYRYSGTSGTWQSIVADGGTVNPSAGANSIVVSSPAIPSTPTSQFTTTQTLVSSSSPQTIVSTTIPGLPSTWIVTASGKSTSLVASSASASSAPPSSSSSTTPLASPSLTTSEQSSESILIIPVDPAVDTSSTSTVASSTSANTLTTSSTPSPSSSSSLPTSSITLPYSGTATSSGTTDGSSSGNTVVSSTVLKTVQASTSNVAAPTSTFLQVVTATGAGLQNGAASASAAASTSRAAVQSSLLGQAAVPLRGSSMATFACVVAFAAFLL